MNILIKDVLTAFLINGNYEIKTASIYIIGNKIVSVDTEPENFKADKTIIGKNKLLIPGLINTHTHAYMSLFKNAADDLLFNDWLFGKILPMEDKLTPQHAYYGSKLAIAEMIKSGTTCFTDMHMFINQTTKAVDETGIRACISRGLVGEGNDEGGARRINEAKQEYNEWKNHERMTFMLAPHAPYTCDPKYLEIVIEEAKKMNLPLNIHLSESLNEIATIKERYGKTPVEFVNDLGLFSVKTLAAHCVHLTENDIDILANNNVNVASNPISNLKLANGIAPIDKLLSKGVNVSLGTDGSASNNSLNMFKELNFASLLLKGINHDAQVISASTALKLATFNGAKSLGLSDELGGIEVGKKADLVLIDIDKPHYYPRNNLVAALAYVSQGSDVATVIVDGKILMEDYELKTIDTEELYFNIEQIYK